jgi:hypothetical protein
MRFLRKFLAPCLPPYRLSTVILAASSLVLVVLATVYSALVYERLARETMQSAKTWSDSVSNLVSGTNTSAFILNDIAAIESNLIQVALLPGIEKIAIFRADGRVLVEAYKSNGAIKSTVGGNALMSLPVLASATRSSQALDNVYESWAGIDTGNAFPSAWVRVHFSLQQRRDELNRLWSQSLWATGALIGLMLAGLHFIIARALRPIRELSDFAKQLPEQIGGHIPESVTPNYLANNCV